MNLTPREMEIIQLIADGLKNRQIAKKLHISYTTVKNNRSNIYKKLDCHNEGEVVALCFRKGLIK